jgi:nucleotide-binding universal stress UspA family protein
VDIHLVGKHVLEDRSCPLPRILIPIDGSINAQAALEHAVCLAQVVQGVSKVTALCVRGPEVKDPEAVFRKARECLGLWGFPPERIRFAVREGDPAKEIAAEAELGEYTTVVMGRRGHTGMKRLSLGAVPLSILHRTVSPTLALISPRSPSSGADG